MINQFDSLTRHYENHQSRIVSHADQSRQELIIGLPQSGKQRKISNS